MREEATLLTFVTDNNEKGSSISLPPLPPRMKELIAGLIILALGFLVLSLYFANHAKADVPGSPCTGAGPDIDGWVSGGLALAGLPDDDYWHGMLKDQAWIESRYDPGVVNLYDQNALEGHPSMGLEQIEVLTWQSTSTGVVYPFEECWDDPVISVAVRAELFEAGHWG